MSVRWFVCPASLLTSFLVAKSYSRTTLSSHARATKSVSRTCNKTDGKNQETRAVSVQRAATQGKAGILKVGAHHTASKHGKPLKYEKLPSRKGLVGEIPFFVAALPRPNRDTQGHTTTYYTTPQSRDPPFPVPGHGTHQLFTHTCIYNSVTNLNRIDRIFSPAQAETLLTRLRLRHWSSFL